MAASLTISLCASLIRFELRPGPIRDLFLVTNRAAGTVMRGTMMELEDLWRNNLSAEEGFIVGFASVYALFQVRYGALRDLAVSNAWICCFCRSLALGRMLAFGRSSLFRQSRKYAFLASITGYWQQQIGCPPGPISQAQTLEQRRRNAKFVKDQEARRGKSEDQIKKRVKEAPKSPISIVWLALLGFVVFGGLVFEVLSRFFL
ncbi:hypothetical protein TARUN_1309 [Trichoderma arundinaceum]|uniref:Stress-associated endoplasmic reticulum protein n=1 Tax=Trichoderma arundinaceum TaxID=490622 RepID=A0A395NXP9_TRIAR|nr:hypothetical protein TARUN_1309 [Trichoderma arundinaceum]